MARELLSGSLVDRLLAGFQEAAALNLDTGLPPEYEDRAELFRLKGAMAAVAFGPSSHDERFPRRTPFWYARGSAGPQPEDTPYALFNGTRGAGRDILIWTNVCFGECQLGFGAALTNDEQYSNIRGAVQNHSDVPRKDTVLHGRLPEHSVPEALKQSRYGVSAMEWWIDCMAVSLANEILSRGIYSFAAEAELFIPALNDCWNWWTGYLRYDDFGYE